MNKKGLILGAVALGTFANVAVADDSPWLVRVRAIELTTQRSNDGLGTSYPQNSIKVGDRFQPEVDISYFFTKNIATELIASYPLSHDVDLNGAHIGSFQELPPTLNLQYHFDAINSFSPYLGAGVTYLRTFNTSLVNGLGLTKDNWGGDLQAGVDYKLDNHWMINFDVKKIWIDVGVTAGGSTVLKLHPDPLVVGMGVGYRF